MKVWLKNGEKLMASVQVLSWQPQGMLLLTYTRSGARKSSTLWTRWTHLPVTKKDAVA